MLILRSAKGAHHSRGVRNNIMEGAYGLLALYNKLYFLRERPLFVCLDTTTTRFLLVLVSS